MTRRFAAGFFVAAALSFLPSVPGRSVSAAAYQAKELIRSSPTVTLAPGASTTFTIGFKNEGSATWTAAGRNFVSVYTYGPKYRASAFRAPGWYGDVQPARVNADVPTGGLAMMSFELRAPSTPGTYTETFHLAAEDLLWIPGGQFTVTIAVIAPSVPSVVTASSSPPSGGASGFGAQVVYRSSERVELEPGGSTVYTIGLKNVGSTRWEIDSRRFVSVYTYDPKYRKSVFQDSSWYRPEQPGRLLPPETAPGQVGYVKFILRAPSTPGTYRETFRLAVEDTLWMPGGEFTIDIVVRGAASVAGQPAPAPTPSTGTATAPSDYRAFRMLTSGDTLRMDNGGTVKYRVAFKNTGDRAWLRFGNDAVTLNAVGENAEAFRGPGWEGPIAARLPQEAVYPGQLALFDVLLQAPSSPGSFRPSFSLAVGERVIEGGTVDVPVEVLSGSVPASAAPAGDPMFGGAGPRGPNVRVGLFYTREPVVVAAAGTYQLLNGDHEPVRTLSGVTSVTFDFATRTYTVRNGGYVWTTDKHVHLHPDDPASTIFEIQSLDNRPSWDPNINFNKFRGNLEVFYTSATDRLWVIEELPIEDYLRGLAETSNGSPYEYQKALVTAARTYALFVLAIGGKHKAEFHDLNTTAGDQVYKGYASELVRPNVVRAAEETRGLAVHYGGEIVVTPYFSRSDGRTRSWTEVWGGSAKPWLVSVPTPYDQGRTLWGHGVGLAASDAVGRAADGASWTDILRYYYTGTDIRRLY